MNYINRFLTYIIIYAILISIIPLANGATISTSITSTSSNLQTTTSPIVTIFNPSKIPRYFGQDRGSVSWQTTLSGFKWNTSNTDFLNMLPKSIGLNNVTIPQIYYNSTIQSYQFSGIGYNVNFYFKVSAYSTSIVISGNVLSSTIIKLQLSSNSTPHNCNSNCTNAQFGNQQFDWSDIPLTDSPSYNNSTHVLSFTVSSTFTIDPLALDGTGQCAASPCTTSVTTSNNNDILVVLESDNNPGCNTPTGAITWSFRVQSQAGDGDCVAEYYSTNSGSGFSAGTFSATCNWTTGNAAFCIIYGVSGTNLASPFDPNGSLPCASNAGGVSSNPSCTISTTNANTFIIGAASEGNNHNWTPGSGFTFLSTGTGSTNQCSSSGAQNRRCSQYQIVSSTQSNLAVTITMNTQDASWDMIADAYQSAASTVTLKVNVQTLPSGSPQATISISGCSVSNSTFTADYNPALPFYHQYNSMTASCSVTLTEPSDPSCPSTCTRYRFDISPHPTAATSISFTTGSSGTTTYTNITYYQLQQKWYNATALNPSTFDGAYPWSLTGSYLSSSSLNQVCITIIVGATHQTCTTNHGTNGLWFNYNTLLSWQTPIGNTWIADNPSSFTDTTAYNNRNVNYNQSSGNAIYGQTPNFYLAFNSSYLLSLIPFSLLVIGLVINYKKHLRLLYSPRFLA